MVQDCSARALQQVTKPAVNDVVHRFLGADTLRGAAADIPQQPPSVFVRFARRFAPRERLTSSSCWPARQCDVLQLQLHFCGVEVRARTVTPFTRLGSAFSNCVSAL